MRKLTKCMTLLAICCCLTGCSKIDKTEQTTSTEESVKEEETNNKVNQETKKKDEKIKNAKDATSLEVKEEGFTRTVKSSMKEGEENIVFRNGLCETKDGYYYFNFMQQLYYVDKKTMKSTPLCFDVDCKHPLNGKCNAYAQHISNINIYNGKLYFDMQEITIIKENGEEKNLYKKYIYSMDLDGSNKEKVLLIQDDDGTVAKEGETGNDSTRWSLIDGKAYVFYTETNGVDSSTAIIQEFDLEKKTEGKIIFEYKDSGFPNTIGIECYDEKNHIMYFYVSVQENIGEDIISDIIYAYSLDKEEIKLVDKNNSTCCVYKDKCYIKQNTTVWEYDYNKETKKEYMVLEDKYKDAYIMGDDEYLYVQTMTTGDLFAIYDGTKKVKEIKVPFTLNMPYGGKDDFLFVGDCDGDGNTVFYFLEKAKIKDEELCFWKINQIG